MVRNPLVRPCRRIAAVLEKMRRSLKKSCPETHSTPSQGPASMLSLDQLEIGQCALITSVQGGDTLGQRLLEMGLLEGEPVEVLGFAPLGDPMEVRLRDYRLSLRRREAARVRVEVRESAFTPTTPQEPANG